MFGIPIDGPTNVLGDNESVVNSASKVEAWLNKKHNAICFHTVREASAAKWIRVGWEPTATNIADIFTKMLDTMQWRYLLSRIFVKGGYEECEGSPMRKGCLLDSRSWRKFKPGRSTSPIQYY
jgi:hypothetical protein